MHLYFTTLKDCGIELGDLKSTIQKIIDKGYILKTDLRTFQKMDLSYVLTKCGFEHDLPPLNTILRSGFLYKLPNVFQLQIDDMYSLTHMVFYMCDFGFKRNPFPRYILSSIKWLITSLLGIMVLKKISIL